MRGGKKNGGRKHLSCGPLPPALHSLWNTVARSTSAGRRVPPWGHGNENMPPPKSWAYSCVVGGLASQLLPHHLGRLGKRGHTAHIAWQGSGQHSKKWRWKGQNSKTRSPRSHGTSSLVLVPSILLFTEQYQLHSLLLILCGPGSIQHKWCQSPKRRRLGRLQESWAWQKGLHILPSRWDTNCTSDILTLRRRRAGDKWGRWSSWPPSAFKSPQLLHLQCYRHH